MDGNTHWIVIGVLVLLVGVVIILPIFTNKKRRQQVENLHSGLRVGDKIMTVGGIIGTIIKINKISPVDTEIMIETGEEDNKTTLLMDVKALYQVLRTEAPAVEIAPEAPVEGTEVTPDVFDIPNNEPAPEAEVALEVEEVAPVVEEVATVDATSEEPTVKKTTRKPIKK